MKVCIWCASPLRISVVKMSTQIYEVGVSTGHIIPAGDPEDKEIRTVECGRPCPDSLRYGCGYGVRKEEGGELELTREFAIMSKGGDKT